MVNAGFKNLRAIYKYLNDSEYLKTENNGFTHRVSIFGVRQGCIVLTLTDNDIDLKTKDVSISRFNEKTQNEPKELDCDIDYLDLTDDVTETLTDSEK